MPQSRNYNEVPVQNVGLYFHHNIRIFLNFIFWLLQREGAASKINPPFLNPSLKVHKKALDITRDKK